MRRFIEVMNCSSSCFNPRTHMGCDWIQLRQCNRTPRFNPRTHMGCDSIRTRRAGLNTWFQSTHPHGMRHLLPEEIRGLYRFNPRTHMGCDPGSGQLLSVRRCFNPRTHMGCDAAYLCYLNGLSCFNPRTHMGCDHFTELGLSTCPEFQSTHPHGMRLPICKLLNLSIFDLRYRENTKNQ